MGPMARAGFGHRVEGVHAVAAAAAAGRVQRLFIEEKRRSRPEIANIAALVDPDAISYLRDLRDRSETEVPQGVVADCRPILPVPVDQLAGPQAAVIALDHIEDPHNVGAIARSASAAGLDGMLVSDRRSAPLSATAFKAAAGAMEEMRVSVVGSIPEALSRLSKAGVWVVGLDQVGDGRLFGLDLLTEPVAIVVGSEGSGLSELVKKRCDVTVSIPMPGRTESLNASVSAALACFEIMRVRSGAVQEAPDRPG